jgi:hypothetical protein
MSSLVPLFILGITQCGYSSLVIIFFMLVISITILIGVLNDRRRYDAGIPLAVTCSAVISAACHPNSDEVPDAAFKPLQ